MTLAHPLVLVVALVCAGAFLLVLRVLDRRASRFALAYSNLALAERALRSRIPYGAILASAWTLAVLAVGVAFAGPHLSLRVPARDAAVALCIDTSGSMSSTDVTPTRAGAAHDAAVRFVDALPASTRVAIVTFSTTATVLAPLTADREALHTALDAIPAPNGGTAIGDALVAAANALPGAGKRAIVLVTDGVNNHGVDPLEAAQTIGGRTIAIYTVGIGTNSGQLVPGTQEEAQIDEDALRAIADSAHGRYTRVENAGQLRAALTTLGGGTVWERHRVDASFAFAAGGGILMTLALLAGIALGKFP